MDNLIGRTLDGLYAVRELIGTGGMANVYKAVVVGENGPVPVGTVVADIREVLEAFPRLKGVMLGRGLLTNPALVSKLQVISKSSLRKDSA